MNIINKFKRKIIQEYNERYRYPELVKGKKKIFCIGRNKTGTTSLEKAFEDLGYIVGNQRKAELLLSAYKNENFESIINYCQTAQVFQDFPFSYPETFKYLDKTFSDSKFILSVRDSPEQWYNSLIKFHAKMFGNGKVPSKKDLQNASYVWKGWIWECNRILYDSPEEGPYNKKNVIESYENYNRSVLEYFKNQPQKLIKINLSERNSYAHLMNFLNISSPYTDFPWKNKAKKVRVR